MIDFSEDFAAFYIFYQEKNEVICWKNLKDSASKKMIESQLLPQALANLFSIRHADLQSEVATSAWFSNIIWSDRTESKTRKDILKEWSNSINKAPVRKIDSNLCLL